MSDFFGHFWPPSPHNVLSLPSNVRFWGVILDPPFQPAPFPLKSDIIYGCSLNWASIESWYLIETHFDSNLKPFPNNRKNFSLNFFFIILFVRWHINFWTSMLTVLKLVVAVRIQNMILILLSLFLHVKVIKNSHSKFFFQTNFCFNGIFLIKWHEVFRWSFANVIWIDCKI